MPIKFACTGCQKRLQAPEKLSGKSAVCPQCGTRVAIPILEVEPDADSLSNEVSTPPKRAVQQTENPSRLSRQPARPKTSESASKQKPAADDSEFFGQMDLSDAEHPSLKRERLRRRSSRADNDEEELDELESYDEPDSGSEHSLQPLPKKRKKSKASSAPTAPDASADDVSPLRQNLYWVLLVALIPLALQIVFGSDDTAARLISTLQAHPELQGVLTDGSSLDMVLQRLPDHKIMGAWLARDTTWHWIFATFSAIGFTALITVLFRTRRAPPWALIWRGLFIGTIGIILLLIIQLIAQFSLGITPRRAHPVIWIILFAIKFIGFSYNCATDPSNGFWLSFLGFTCGVGLCEELCKAMLLLGHYKGSDNTAGWGTACAWGLACGAGFGVSEGIMYSGEYYNGLSGADIYAVRFISCVALHAIWSGIVGILLYRERATMYGDMEYDDMLTILARCFLMVMILHGLYDTFLKREMAILALLTALISFGWLAFLIQQSRKRSRKIAA